MEDWWVEGENSTLYFHSRAASHHSRQLVHQLKNEKGNWTGDPENLQRMAREFFQKLYTAEASQPCHAGDVQFLEMLNMDKIALHRQVCE